MRLVKVKLRVKYIMSKMPVEIKRSEKPFNEGYIEYIADPNTLKIDLYYFSTDQWFKWCKRSGIKVNNKYEYIGMVKYTNIKYYRARWN